MVYLTLLAPLVALALLFGMSSVERWHARTWTEGRYDADFLVMREVTCDG